MILLYNDNADLRSVFNMLINIELLKNNLKEIGLEDVQINDLITNSSVVEGGLFEATSNLTQEDLMGMEDSSRGDSLYSEYHSPEEEFTYVYEKLFGTKSLEKIEDIHNHFRLSESSKGSKKGDMSVEGSDIPSNATTVAAKVKRFKKDYQDIYHVEIPREITDNKITDAFQLLENKRTFAGLTSEEQNNVINGIRRSARLSGVKVPEQKIRGSLSTYAKHSMGGFDFSLKEDRSGNEKMYVSEDAEITRPINVTGNLGQTAGDHVVPFSLFTRHIQNKVKGKDIHEAIALLRVLSASIGLNQSLIDKAATYTPGAFSDAKSFLFLKSELIPSMLAQWNQNEIAAFKAHDSASRDPQEGGRVKNFLIGQFNFAREADREKEIKDFVSIIDYKPITEIFDKNDLITGERTNDISTLASVVGSVITTYDYIHGINNDDAIIIVNEMLNQHGWIDYYRAQNESLNQDSIVNVVIQEVTEQYPLLQDSLAFVNHSSHLVRSEKGILLEVKEERQFIELLTRDLKGKDKLILQEIKAGMRSVSIPSNSGSRSVLNSFVKLIPEDNHSIDHQQNVINLSKMLEDGEIKVNTVICLERKEGGNNFGMKDVKLLAAILRYNDNNEQSLPIAKTIESSAIYQDAMLYNKAQVCGVEVVGIEGKSLQYNKDSSHYDQTRESYMANRINQLTASGKNVILPIGSSHVLGIKKQLEESVISSDKSKETKEKKCMLTSMRERLQENSTSSFSQTGSASQNKKDTQQIR